MLRDMAVLGIWNVNQNGRQLGVNLHSTENLGLNKWKKTKIKKQVVPFCDIS